MNLDIFVDFLVPSLFIGSIAGFLGGLLGVGGGIIVVPALLFLFDYFNLFPISEYAENTTVLFALGTSLASIVFTTSASALAQLYHARIDWTIIKRWALFLMIGSFAAAFIAELLPSVLITLFIGTFIVVVSIIVLSPLNPKTPRIHPDRMVTGVIATSGGFVSGLAGIGGGNIVVPTLLFYNTPIVTATAASSALGTVIALCGAAGYIVNGWDTTVPYSLGYVYLPALLPLSMSCLIFAPFGVKLALRMDPKVLRRLFGCLMVIVAARMFYVSLANIS